MYVQPGSPHPAHGPQPAGPLARSYQLSAWHQVVDEIFDVAYRSGRSAEEVATYLSSLGEPCAPFDDLNWLWDDLFAAAPPLNEEHVRANAAARAVDVGILSREEAWYVFSVSPPLLDQCLHALASLDARIATREREAERSTSTA